MDFDQAFEKLHGIEGGYSDRSKAADPGGKTMYGVTEAVARKHGYTGPMRDLPIPLAKMIARADYWAPCKCDDLPPDVRYCVFDASFNSGYRQASKWLQRAVGVTDDGVVGKNTLAAAKNFPASVITSRLNGHRLRMMKDLDNWHANSRGWADRIAKLLMEA